MTIETVYRALFPDDPFQGDMAALRQMRDEIEILREQLSIRIEEVKRTFAQFATEQADSMGGKLAVLLFLSRDLAEQNARIEARGKLPPWKTQAEIQRAHDVLTGMISNADLRRAIFGPVDNPTLQNMQANADVLCWTLGHQHSDTFAKNLALLEAEMFSRGYGLADAPSD